MYIQDRFGSYRSIEWTKTDWNCTRYSIITCFAQTSDSLARLTQTLARMPDVMDMRERNIKHAGYSSRVARKKPFISLQNQKKRLEFAKTHQLKQITFWKKVIFSDESKFNIFGRDGRRTVWRKPNTVLNPKKLRSTVKHGGLGFKTKHAARYVEMWCLFHCKQQLHTHTQSPDINVIENLSATLETAVQKHKIRNKSHLKQVLQEEWDKISPDTTKKLVESVPRPLEDIIKAKGHATKY
ncbi:transposable element Tc1 transposase [Trichonephila clavipes]|nr:transposable element Tc1 transposase [Trichonephila clavipes]